MAKRKLRLLLVLLSSLWSVGCSSTWYFPEGLPQQKIWVDTTVNFRSFQTFAMIPNSALANDRSLTQDEENGLMFYTVNQLELRGYRCVDNLDSADFVICQQVSNDYVKGENLDPSVDTQLVWQAVKPFSLLTSGFGTYFDVPIPENWDYRVVRMHPKLRETIFDGKTHRVIRRFAGGGVVADENYRTASQYLIWSFGVSLPFARADGRKGLFGTGMMGLIFNISSYDGHNFWPVVTSVVSKSPAEHHELKPGDNLLSLDGQSLKNVDAFDFLRKVRGPPGRALHFRVWHWGGKLRDVTVIMGERTNP